MLKGISPSPLFQYSDHSVINYVWENVYVRGTDVRAEQFFGFMKFKYKELRIRSSIQLENLQMFN